SDRPRVQVLFYYITAKVTKNQGELKRKPRLPLSAMPAALASLRRVRKPGGPSHDDPTPFPKGIGCRRICIRLRSGSRGARLSNASGESDCCLSCWRRDGHVRALVVPILVGAARTIIHYRESSGRIHQYWDRGGRAGASRWLYASWDRRSRGNQCHVVRKAQFQFRSRLCNYWHEPRTSGDAHSPFGSRPNYSRVYCLRESQSRKDRHGIGWQRNAVPPGRRAV